MFKMLKVKMTQKGMETVQKQKFNDILNFAKSIIDKNNLTNTKHPIFDVIKMLGRKTQSEFLAQILQTEDQLSSPDNTPENLFFKKDFDKFKKKVNVEKMIKLKRDLIIPMPWKRASLVNTLSNIGMDRSWGPWTQQSFAHNVELWLPMGIVWVHGGNHSIATGVIRGEGIIKTYNVYDISGIYDLVYTDGAYYYQREDNSIIAPVQNLEFAAIFEIGRLLKENDISF